MRDELDLLDLAADAVAMVDPLALTVDELAHGSLALQRHLDRVRVLHARLVRAADNARVWQGTGSRDMADWLARQTKTSYGDASSRVRLGEALDQSPELADAVERGDVSAATAEALHDAVTNPPANADMNDLIDSVKGTGPRDAKAAAERFKDIHSAETDEDAEERRHQRRSVRSTPATDGMVTTTVTLPSLQSREFHNAISSVAGKPSEGDTRTTEQRLADGLVQLCRAYAKGQVLGGREKPTILITIDALSFGGITNEAGVTAQGDRIPAHVVRHLAEQANLQRVLHAGATVLDLGREVRFATEAQYRALVARDGGCRWEECHIPAAWCEVDHLQAFEDGGTTDLINMALWCSHHHHEKHRPGVQVLGDAHDLRLRLANGTIVHCPPRGNATRTRPATAAA
ncbi:MAG: DUF222 domain-containing protein [Actinomycetota bacterium]|nr:DUF222 domain-containing protein [Actinomycetota bacterium]